MAQGQGPTQTDAQIAYFFKEDTNQILVSGSDTVAKTNALITSSKNPIAEYGINYTSKIANYGFNTTYVVQNGPEFSSLIPGQSLNTFNPVYVSNQFITSPINVVGDISGTGASVTLGSSPVSGQAQAYQILNIIVITGGENWVIGETFTISQSTLGLGGFSNVTGDLTVTILQGQITTYGTEIPLTKDQELWINRGYNTDGGDGDTYKYNPHLHRAYKSYIIVETGSGSPSMPFQPDGNNLNEGAANNSGGDIPNAYIEKQFAILGNEASLSPNVVEGEFAITNPSRRIHPFVFTKYSQLSDPPIFGAGFRLYREASNYSVDNVFSFSTNATPNINQITTDTNNFNTTTKVNIKYSNDLTSTLQQLSSSYNQGKSGGQIKLTNETFTNQNISFDIDGIETIGSPSPSYFELAVSNPDPSPPGLTIFSAGQSLDVDLLDFPQYVGQFNQSQFGATNTSAQLFPSTVFNELASYTFTSSIFPTTANNGTSAIGSSQFGLYTDLDYYVQYNARVDANYSQDVRIEFTSSANTSSFFDIPPGNNVNFRAVPGTVTQSGYNIGFGDPTFFKSDGTYNSAKFDVTINNSTSPGTPSIPPDILAKRYSSVYISYSSSLSSSLDGLYVFNQLPQTDLQVTASMFLAAWTGSADGDRYGVVGSDYATALYGEGEEGEGPTWPTASIRFYTGSYPNGVPQIGGNTPFDTPVYEEIFRDENIHINGLSITSSFLIPSQSVNIKDCLSLSLQVSSGSANSASVENSLVVRNYYLEFNTPDVPEGDGLVPTFIENAFTDTDGLSNTPDCQPTLNNALGERRNQYIQEVDYTTGIYDPINFQAILSGSAQKAAVPESNYTTRAITQPRYFGSETTANQVNSIEGLIGGFGALPVIDYKTAYFAYCDQIIDPYPVINNKVQFNIKYLINESGDALQPNSSPYTAFDVRQSWLNDGGSKVAINQVSGSSQYDLLNGPNIISQVAKEPVAVLWSQTGASSYKSVATTGSIPLAGDSAIVSTFSATFLNYNMTAVGRNFDSGDIGSKIIGPYNLLDKAGDTDSSGNPLYVFSTSSRYGVVNLDAQYPEVINAASSSIVSVLSPAPNPTLGANTNVSYASTGEIFFNRDYFAIYDSSATPPGFDYLTGNQLSDVYGIKVRAEFPSTVPQEVRTDSGGWNDGSDYNRTNVGKITLSLQEKRSFGYAKVKIKQLAPPILRLYFPANQTVDVDLTQAFGSNKAGLRDSDKLMYVEINPQALNNAVNQQGLSKNNALYCSFIFELQSDDSVTIQAQKRYKWVVEQNYGNENIDPNRNYFNPAQRPQNLGSGPTPFPASAGPYVNASVFSQQGISNDADGALNPPYWDFWIDVSQQTGPFTFNDDYTPTSINPGEFNVNAAIQFPNQDLEDVTQIYISEFDTNNNSIGSLMDELADVNDDILGSYNILDPNSGQTIVYDIKGITFVDGANPYYELDVVYSSGTNFLVDGTTYSTNISETLTYDRIELISENGNITYGKGYYQTYLPYTASENAQFPGGFEPIDTSIPAYNIPWSLEVDDEIRFVNSELETYRIIEITPPEANTHPTSGSLVLRLDRQVGNSVDKDFFLIRRYRPSDNTILVSNKFPYGSLKTEQRFVEADNVTTLFGGNPTAGGDTFSSESISTTTQSGSYVTSIKPLSKKDNTPTGLLFPEFPTRLIEVDSDKIIEQLRDNKLIT